MLKRLHVRNLRGFDDLQIDKLSRINLVAGKNNVGKSTLLEAIFLLGSAADSRVAINSHIARTKADAPLGASISETHWKTLFHELDTSKAVEISADHSTIGRMEQTITWERPLTTEIRRDEDDRTLTDALSTESSLKFRYADPAAGVIEGEAREMADKVQAGRKVAYAPFAGAILQPGARDDTEDASRLGRLRRQKRGDSLLCALRVVDSRLRGIEENSSSGRPMIWVDIGLRELVPLPVMGAGMIHFARIVLAAASVPGGVLLVDEVENGLHHSVLPDVWRAIAKAAQQYDLQVFATTHSFECIEAAYEALGPDGFGLHRLDTVDGVTRCVTYGSGAIEGAIRHNMEVR